MARGSPPERVLCIKLKHIGDVLLMTPTIRAIRLAWPACRIAALVPRGIEGVLQGNPDLEAILTLDRRAGLAGAWRTIRAAREYAPDLVLEFIGRHLDFAGGQRQRAGDQD